MCGSTRFNIVGHLENSQFGLKLFLVKLIFDDDLYFAVVTGHLVLLNIDVSSFVKIYEMNKEIIPTKLFCIHYSKQYPV